MRRGRRGRGVGGGRLVGGWVSGGDGVIRENVHFISACGAAPSHRPTISYAGSTEPEPRRRYWS